MKKKFKDTKVGQFLLQKIPNVVESLAGNSPVASVIQTLIGGSNMSEADKEIALVVLTTSFIGGWVYGLQELDVVVELLKIVFIAYFGGRSSEKVFGNKMHK